MDREARERQRSKKQRDHLSSIVQHAKDFKEHHRATTVKRARYACGRLVKYVIDIEFLAWVKWSFSGTITLSARKRVVRRRFKRT